MRTTRTIAAGLTGLVLATGALTAAAGAQEPSGGATTAAPSEHRVAEALCRRIPRVQERLTDHRDRVTGDADTPGSVLWLDARAEQADDAGHPRLADQLHERADRRAARLEVIDARLAELDEAAARCAEAGIG